MHIRILPKQRLMQSLHVFRMFLHIDARILEAVLEREMGVSCGCDDYCVFYVMKSKRKHELIRDCSRGMAVFCRGSGSGWGDPRFALSWRCRNCLPSWLYPWRWGPIKVWSQEYRPRCALRDGRNAFCRIWVLAILWVQRSSSSCGGRIRIRTLSWRDRSAWVKLSHSSPSLRDPHILSAALLRAVLHLVID